MFLRDDPLMTWWSCRNEGPGRFRLSAARRRNGPSDTDFEHSAPACSGVDLDVILCDTSNSLWRQWMAMRDEEQSAGELESPALRYSSRLPGAALAST